MSIWKTIWIWNRTYTTVLRKCGTPHHSLPRRVGQFFSVAYEPVRECTQHSATYTPNMKCLWPVGLYNSSGKISYIICLFHSAVLSCKPRRISRYATAISIAHNLIKLELHPSSQVSSAICESVSVNRAELVFRPRRDHTPLVVVQTAACHKRLHDVWGFDDSAGLPGNSHVDHHEQTSLHEHSPRTSASCILHYSAVVCLLPSPTTTRRIREMTCNKMCMSET